MSTTSWPRTGFTWEPATGRFAAPSANRAFVDPASGPSAIAVGDFNNDHKLDVAVALAYTDSISISLGNGDGTFQPATNIALSVPGNPLTRSSPVTSAMARLTWRWPSPARAVRLTTSSCSWAMATEPSLSRARSRSG